MSYTPGPYAQQSDVERALGGAATLVELADKDKDGIADPDFVADILTAGSAWMGSLIERAIPLATLQPPFPVALVLRTADLCAFVAWSRGSLRQAAPDNVVQAKDAAEAWGVAVGDRRATLGIVPQSTLDPPAEQRDFDPKGTGISIRAFKGGFR